MLVTQSERAELAAVLEKQSGGVASPIFSTIAKLYLSTTNREGWKDSHVWGIISLVFDRAPPASRKICIFNLVGPGHDDDTHHPVVPYEQLFSQELYESMEYHVLEPRFHTFETTGIVVGLSFADADEADIFAGRIRSLTPKAGTTQSAEAANKPGRKKKRGLLARLFRRETHIGRPTNVVHKKHVGHDPSMTQQLPQLPADWVDLFRAAGISKKDLADPERAAVIFQTIKETIAPQGLNNPAVIGPPVVETYNEAEWTQHQDQNEQYLADVQRYEQEREQYQQAQAQYEQEYTDVYGTPPPALPVHAWTEMVDDAGNVYYSNHALEITQWERPFELFTDEEKRRDQEAKRLEISSPMPIETDVVETPQSAAPPPAEAAVPAAPDVPDVPAAPGAPEVRAAESPQARVRGTISFQDMIKAGVSLKPVNQDNLPDLTLLPAGQETSLMGALRRAMATRFQDISGAADPSTDKAAAATADDWDD